MRTCSGKEFTPGVEYPQLKPGQDWETSYKIIPLKTNINVSKYLRPLPGSQ